MVRYVATVGTTSDEMTIKVLYIVTARLTISIWDMHRSWTDGADIGVKKGEKMTRYEAIDILKNTIVRFGRTNGKTVYAEALQMAIKALEEPQWIPCSERLPEEDTEVLISYRYKEGEGDTDHVNIDITSYGTVCFGGREIHTLKEWRQPFDYFHANYEVIAWMPLPEPYQGEGE